LGDGPHRQLVAGRATYCYMYDGRRSHPAGTPPPNRAFLGRDGTGGARCCAASVSMDEPAPVTPRVCQSFEMSHSLPAAALLRHGPSKPPAYSEPLAPQY
jgi:hypothetical protein